MPKIHISRSISIDAPVDQVYACVRDFKQWSAWSPWIIMEPDCALTYAEDGRSYSWEGDVVGSGRMVVADEQAGEGIDYELTFLKPWKSEADVRFSFVGEGEQTEVRWTMDSSLPFFMFWMKGQMEAFVGLDYLRGLTMLKDYVETGSVPSQLEFLGVQAFAGFRYAGVRTNCGLGDVGSAMEKDFATMLGWLKEAGLEPTGKPFSIYHEWNMKEGTTEYTLGFPLDEVPAGRPSGILEGALASGQVYPVRHTGPYRHLGNAWSSGFTHARSKVFAHDKKGPSFEIYESNPKEVPEHDIVTTVYFSVKG